MSSKTPPEPNSDWKLTLTSATPPTTPANTATDDTRKLTFWDATPNPRDEGPTPAPPDSYKFNPPSDPTATDNPPSLSLTFSQAPSPSSEPRERSRPAAEPSAGPGLYESHMHTTLCKHAKGHIEQYATVAHERGLAGIIVTCHNPLPDGYAAAMRMDEAQLDEYVMYIDRARHVMEGRVDVRLGLEADFVPGYERYVEHQLAQHDFDFVLGSVHPQIPEYQTRFYKKDTFKFQQLYFQHLADSAETGLFDSLAHPDLIKMLMPRHWSVSKILDDVCRSLDRIAATGVAMEFNTSGWRRPMAEACPGPRILYEMARRRIPITLGSDAHSPQRVGENFRKALRLIQAAGYRKVSMFHKRERIDLDINTVYRTLVPETPAATQPV